MVALDVHIKNLNIKIYVFKCISISQEA